MAFGGRSQLKMSEETFDFVCTACAEDNKTVEAVKYCVECCTYCCQPCIDAHKKFPMLRNHNLMDVSQGNQASNQQPSLLEIPTERCRIHKAKVVDMYCEHHDNVGCSTCFVKDHKSCKDSHIHSIPDMIDTIFKWSDCKQTRSLLKDMVVAMETVSKSKDTKLQTLKKAKNQALGNINVFQKALETVIRKRSEATRKDVEAAYKDMETDILQDKHTVDSIRDDLQTADAKLKQSKGNRAQQFVCTKLTHGKLIEADNQKMKKELQRDTDLQITFIPEQSLMDYINDLQGIGQVLFKRTSNLYKIKRSRDITIKLSDDSLMRCNSGGCCLTDDSHLLITDVNNKKLKLIDIQKMSMVDYCTLDSDPYGVCCINKLEVAVACQYSNKIQFVSIHNKMTAMRQIKMSHTCYGIAFKDGKLYVTDWGESVFVYDMAGNNLKTLLLDNTGILLFTSSKHVAFNESGNRMFVGNGNNGNNGIVCFDGMNNYLSTYGDEDLKCVAGVCVDGRGNIFVTGYDSHNVVQFSEDGKKLGVVAMKGDGIKEPRSVCFHQGLNILFVTMCNSDVVKMYELR